MNARNRQLAPQFQLETFFGQLQTTFVVHMPVSLELGIERPETLILAAIKSCKIEQHDRHLDVHLYKDHGRTEVVDITSIQCVVGRVRDRNRWVIIDRSGSLARAQYNPELEGEE